MQTVGPYTLITPLGTCQVGDAWSGLDETGRPVTVAVLNERASADQRWRDAFVATATALSQAQVDRLPIVAADFRASFPWVACSPERGPGAAQIFLALGQTLQAPPDNAGPAGRTPLASDDDRQAEPLPVRRRDPDAVPEPSPATDEPTSSAPASPGPTVAAPASGAPTSAAPASGAPTSTPPLPPLPPASPPHPPLVHSSTDRRRPRLALGLMMIGALLLGVVGGALGTIALKPNPSPTGAAVATDEPVQPGLPTNPPKQPGIEPPKGGRWPDDWPAFTNADRTREMTDLDGLGFSFNVPQGWDCTQTGRTAGFVRYRCGVPEGDGVSIGGDLIVRACVRPCTEGRRTRMRRLEEAWGLHWIRSGRFTTWAEGPAVDNGRYGLVYLSYWRSKPEGAIDRQLVLRMTAPHGQENVLRKVANSVREVTFTI